MRRSRVLVYLQHPTSFMLYSKNKENINMNQAELKKWVHYDGDSGLFFYVLPYLNNKPTDIEYRTFRRAAGNGIKIDQWVTMTRRIAYLYITGEEPSSKLYSVNGDRYDDRWCNITTDKPVKPKPVKPSYRSNVKGVSFDTRDQVWVAKITKDKKRHFLGTFKLEASAIAARQVAELYYK